MKMSPCLSVEIATSGALTSHSKFDLAFGSNPDGAGKLESQLDAALRTFMLYSTFCKINIESEQAKDLQVTESSLTAKYRLQVGNILTVELSLAFFTEPS